MSEPRTPVAPARSAYILSPIAAMTVTFFRWRMIAIIYEGAEARIIPVAIIPIS